MTVLDGVRATERTPDLWPAGKSSQPLTENTQEVGSRLLALGLGLQAEGLAPPYRMRVRAFDGADAGIGLEIEGATAAEEARMRRLRDRLAEQFGFRAPNHESYVFHVSVAYLLMHIDGQERRVLNEFFEEQLPALRLEFELGKVEFCAFEDMYAYPRIFFLGDEGVEGN